MMISPETFYEMDLKGKTIEEILTVISRLKKKMARLKKIMEHPNYANAPKFCPSESVMLSCYRDYLLRAQMALMEAGGTYTPSAAEKKAMDFDENIPFINKVVFCIGGYWNGYETRTYTIDDDKISTYIEHSLNLTPSNIGDGEPPEIDKEYFLNSLEALHLGEWRRRYDSDVCDGTQWNLDIYYSNGHKPVKFYGNNSYPYNFDQLLELFEMEK